MHIQIDREEEERGGRERDKGGNTYTMLKCLPLSLTLSHMIDIKDSYIHPSVKIEWNGVYVYYHR